MNALVYARVSTVAQADGFSLDSQIDMCCQRARELGADTVRILQDTHTGMELDRPAMEELRQHVSRRDVDVIVAYDPDRFSRDLTDLLVVAREIDAAGIELHFVNFDWRRSPEGLLFLQLRGAIAQFEHALIRERTVRGKTRKAARGKLRTHAATYGYVFNRETDELEISGEHSRVVRQVFEWYTREGLTMQGIANRLNALGIPAPRGPVWRSSTICRMLRNETYVGRLRRVDEREDWAPIITPVIVSREAFNRAQEIRQHNRRFNRGNNKCHQFLVQRLVRCGVCGRSLRGVGHSRGARTYRYYRCPGRDRTPGGPICTLQPVRADRLDAVVWSELARFLGDVRLYESCPGSRSDGPEFERLKAAGLARLDRLRLASRRIETSYCRGHLDEDRYLSYKNEIRHSRLEVGGELRRIHEEEKVLSAGSRELPTDAAALVASGLRFSDRQSLARLLVRSITVHPDCRVVIEALYTCPVVSLL